MTSAPRIQAMGARASSYLPYVCLQCQHQAATAARQAIPRLRTPIQPRRSASSIPFTERLRQKIWGTTTPPGPENPYGAPGTFEQHRKKNLKERDEARLREERVPNKPSVIDEDTDSEVGKATTWEGMRVVGQKNYGLKEWDEEHPYQGYVESSRVLDKDHIVAIIHRALVEVMTLREANLPLVLRRDPFDPTGYGSAENYETYKYRIAQGATFSKSNDGESILDFKNWELEQTILDCIMPQSSTFVERGMEEDEPLEAQPADPDQEQEQEDDITGYSDQDQKQGKEEGMTAAIASEQEELELHDLEDTELSELTPEEVAELEALGSQSRAYVPVYDAWRDVSLTDSEFKFAVLKRVMQLTGRRIPDPEIAKIEDAKGLFFHLVRKPKPDKLVQTLRTKQAVGLPNVELRGKRYTPIDKEKEIGRWKVIEQELKARGLPVTGKGTVGLGQPVGRV